MKSFYFFRCLILSIFFGIVVTSLSAQNGQVRGFIYDKSDGEPIIFTNVYFKGTSIGASTDVNGYYVISKIPEGDYTLQVTAIGYDTLRLELHVGRNDLITKNLYITKATYTLEAVNITAEREERMTETRISVLTVSPKEIERLPSVGGQTDFAQYLQVVPGIIFTGDQGGQLYVRGGSPIQNKVMMDGMTIYNPFHSIGLFSVFETDLIRNADVHTGGFNADYGGRISSVMDISIRDGNKMRHTGKVQATTFGANVMAEGPLKKMKTNSPAAITYVLSAKGSYLEETSKVLYPYADTINKCLPFNYLDLYGKFTLSAGNGSKVSMFGFYYDDKVNNYKDVIDSRWKTYGGGFSFIVMPESTSMLFEGKVAISKYETAMDETYPTYTLDRYSDIFGLTAGMDFNYFFGKSDVKWGFEINAGNNSYSYSHPASGTIELKDNSTEFGVYAKYKGIFGKFIVEPGMRIQWYASMGEFSPEPRLSLKYNITPSLRLKASGGMYSQNLIAAASDRDVVNLFYGFLASVRDVPDNFRDKEIPSSLQKAWHAVFGIEYDLGTFLSLNLEGYYKDFTQLTNTNRNKIYDSNETDKPEALRSNFIIEDGQAYGMDFSAKFDFEDVYIWLAYSLGYVERRDEYIVYNPHFDRRHNLNLLASYKWGKANDWEVSARWNYGSGFPFTPTAGFYEKLDFPSVAIDYIYQNGELATLYGDLYSQRLPSYHRLDLNIKKTFFLGENMSLDVDLGVTNVYNRDNIFYYNVMEDVRVDQLPILPSIGLCFKF